MLEVLCSYYRRAAADEDQTVSPPGYATAGVSGELVISREGDLLAANPLQDTVGKKTVPRQCIVPQPPKRSGQKPEAAFLYENVEFLFGIYKDEKGAAYRFQASREKHEAVLAGCEDKGAKALLRFFAKRTQGSVDYPEVDTSLLRNSRLFVVFRLQGDEKFLHERPAIRDAWERYRAGAQGDQPLVQCLITGKMEPLAVLHGNVAGFGADKPTLVGFNQDSFCSFGLYGQQGANAPVGQTAAFEYVTALNMLCQDRRHYARLANDKVIFWAEREAPEEESTISFFIQGSPGADTPETVLDAEQTERIRGLLRSVVKGGKAALAPQSAQVQFYLMGLSSNKTRLVVRFFEQSSYGNLLERLADHYRMLEIDGMQDPYPSPRRLLVEGALEYKAENVPAALDAALMRSILKGLPYPQALYQAVIRRIRAEGKVSALRAAVIKATLNRQEKREVLNVALDQNERDLAYCLGRLFALFEQTQRDALPDVNTTVTDKYLNSALATPQMVFPVLLTLNDKHLSKLRGGEDKDKAIAAARRREIGEIMDVVSLRHDKAESYAFPDSLNANEQGKFLVGYYHQRQAFFARAAAKAAEKKAAAEAHTKTGQN